MDNIYLFAHSLGVIRALKLIVKAESNEIKADWYVDLKGIISLGGAIWGTNPGELTKIPGTGFYDLERLF